MAKTIEAIAGELGVSITTVRLVLLGKARQYRISAKTEARVREYTEQYGYEINHVARSLRLQRSDALALIVPRLSNHFFAQLAELLEIRCRKAGLQLWISCCYDNPDTQLALIKQFRERNVDGLFLVPANADMPTLAAAQLKQRLVLLDRDFGGSDYAVVVTDNRQSGYQLAQRLHAFCVQRGDVQPDFLLFAGNSGMPSISQRLIGLNAALDDLGLGASQRREVHVTHNDFHEGEQAMAELIDTGQPLPKVLVCSSIPLFEGAMQALKQRLGGAPETMVLATFDDHSMLDFLRNPVCSVRQDYEFMIEQAFSEMAQLISGEGKPAHHIASMRLMPRNMD